MSNASVINISIDSGGAVDAAAGNASSTNGSPLQAIMQFLREVKSTLGRNTNGGQVKLPSRVKLQMLALAILAYAQQARASTGASGAGGKTRGGRSGPNGELIVAVVVEISKGHQMPGIR